MTRLVDKVTAKMEVSKLINGDIIIETLGVYNDFDSINFDKLPDDFVIKTTHDSGCVFICKKNEGIDFKHIKYKIEKSLNRNYYYLAREWPYKDVKPRILIEELLITDDSSSIKDYKVLCFNGSPNIIQVMSERNGSDFFLNHYDTHWNEIFIERKSLSRNIIEIPRPLIWEKC